MCIIIIIYSELCIKLRFYSLIEKPMFSEVLWPMTNKVLEGVMNRAPKRMHLILTEKGSRVVLVFNSLEKNRKLNKRY